jgi:ParB family chromosome partitioning protein
VPKRVITDEALFEETSALAGLIEERDETALREVWIGDIVPNRFNPRKYYDKEALEGLTTSIREAGWFGALDGRLIESGRVEIAHGTRRLLAAKQAGLEKLPIFIHKLDDERMKMIAILENIQREDLTLNEQADFVGAMHREIRWSVREIARRVGKPQKWVEERLAIFKAPADVREMVDQREDAARHAMYIARLPGEADRRAIEEKVLDRSLTAAQTLQVVKKVEAGQPTEEALGTALRATPLEVSSHDDSIPTVVVTRTRPKVSSHDDSAPAILRRLATQLSFLDRLEPDHVTSEEQAEVVSLLNRALSRITYLLERLGG